MTNEEKALLYDSLLKEHDVKVRQVSVLKSKFDLTVEDEKKIKQIKSEMAVIERKANSLGGV